MMTAQRLLVPVGFRADADHAVESAIGLASTLRVRVTLLQVMQSPPWSGVDLDVTLPYAYIQDLEAEIAHRIQAYGKRVTAAGLVGEIVVVHGVPFQEILETATRQQVDLIVMGTHDRTGLHHVLLGDMAEKVVHLAPCPVLVVRQPTMVPIS